MTLTRIPLIGKETTNRLQSPGLADAENYSVTGLKYHQHINDERIKIL